jgi:hypothetical protein
MRPFLSLKPSFGRVIPTPILFYQPFGVPPTILILQQLGDSAISFYQPLVLPAIFVFLQQL